MRENITPHQRALRAAAERTPVKPEGYRLGGVRHDDTHSLRAATTAIPGARVEREFRCTCGVEFGLQYDTNARIAYRRHRLAASRRRTPKPAAEATIKRDVNGRTVATGDTVVWEADGGLSHHAGYVSERQDSDPIDIRVQPVGAAGDTYVVIKARRLRLAKPGNEGRHTVADLVDMADALEAPQPKSVVVTRSVEEDDKTVSETVVPVTGPKFEVMSAAHHRNGVSGRGFYVGIVKHWGDLPEGEDPRLLQVIAVPEDDAPEDISKITFENGSGVEIYVTDLMVIAKQGTVAFGINSFRGDHFFAEARAVIIQTRNDWDNQMLALRR